MSVQSRIRKIQKSKGTYVNRKRNIIKTKPLKEEKELSMEEIAKQVGLKI